VTRLDLRLHPVGPELLCGFLAFPRERAAEVARVYRDFMAEASDQVGGGLLLGAGLGGVCSIVFCHLGSVEAGEEAVAPLRALQPSLDAVAPNPYRAFQRIWDTSNPPGVRAHLREASLRELPDEAIDTVIARANLPPRASPTFSSGRSAVRSTSPDGPVSASGCGPPVPSLDPGRVAWVDGLMEAVEPFARRARA